MKKSSEMTILDLDHPTPRLRSFMRGLGWIGLASSCIGLIMLGLTLSEHGLTSPYEPLRLSASLLIGGLLAAAIGFWDRQSLQS